MLNHPRTHGILTLFNCHRDDEGGVCQRTRNAEAGNGMRVMHTDADSGLPPSPTPATSGGRIVEATKLRHIRRGVRSGGGVLVVARPPEPLRLLPILSLSLGILIGLGQINGGGMAGNRLRGKYTKRSED